MLKENFHGTMNLKESVDKTSKWVEQKQINLAS